MNDENVLLVNYDKRWGGGQEYLFTLIKGLLQNSFSVSQLVVPNSPSQERFEREFANNSNYKNLALKRNSISSLWKIICFARNYKILHVHREHDIWLGALIKLFVPKIKLVFSQHIAPTKKRNLLFLFDEIICNSLYSQALFENMYKRKTKMLFPSVSVAPSGGSSTITLRGNPILLMSGAFHKNQSEMLDIFRQILAELPQAKLYFIGPCQEQNLIDELKTNIGDKKLTETVTILPSHHRESYLTILKQAQIVVSSYYKEAFGLSVLEAALMGKAIIVYESGGPVEILRDYPKACMVKNKDQRNFARQVIDCFKSGDYKKEVSTDILESRFSPKQLIEGHLKIYRALLNSSVVYPKQLTLSTRS
jgi:glycosyltransferase involved in cell wall biosynthesis